MSSVLVSPGAKKLYQAGEMLNTLKSYTKAENTFLSMVEDVAEEKTALTLSQYKEKMTLKLNNLSSHPTREDSTMVVTISEAGWHRMQEDKNYESFVLGKVAEELVGEDPWYALGSSSYSILRFGDKEETFQKDSWGAEYPGNIKSYLTEQFTGLFGANKKSATNGNFLIKLAKKNIQRANQKQIENLQADLSRLNTLGITTRNRFRLATAQNSLTLMQLLMNV